MGATLKGNVLSLCSSALKLVKLIDLKSWEPYLLQILISLLSTIYFIIPC